MSNNKKPFGADETLEQELRDLYAEQGEELGRATTSAELDASIFAMAQEAIDAGSKESLTDQTNTSDTRPWLQRMKYPVSVAAALVMTVGITRLMVHLSEQPTSAAQMIEVASERAEVTLANADSMDRRASQHEESKAKQQEALLQERQRVSRQQVESDAYAKRLKIESEQRRTALSKEQKTLVEEPVVAEITVSELDSELVEDRSTFSNTAEDMVVAMEVMAPPVAKAVAKKVVDESDETITVTGSRIKQMSAEKESEIDTSSAADHYGVLDEAVRGYPLPEVWLEMIEKALNEDDEITALDEWNQFIRTYPDYKVNKKLLDQITTLQKIGENQ